MREANWRANKQPVPERDAGEDIIEAVVGKMKQGNRKFVHWREKGGELYEKNTCTWQVVDAALDEDDLVGKRVQFKLRQTVFVGTIKHKSNDHATEYWVEFDSRRHSNRFVDLELHKAVGDGEYSWWRLDGYETNEGGDEGESDEGGE